MSLDDEDIEPILQELAGRLSFKWNELAERDKAALLTAFAKTAALGFNRGCERVAFDFTEFGFGVDLAPEPMSCVDEWHERFGRE